MENFFKNDEFTNDLFSLSSSFVPSLLVGLNTVWN